MTFELYPEVSAEVRAAWKPGDRCHVRGEGDTVFTVSDGLRSNAAMLLCPSGSPHGWTSYHQMERIES